MRIKTKRTTPQFLMDEKGKKAFVVLSVKEYEEIMEDLHDLAVIAERRDEPKMTIEDFEEQLRADGLI